jgi:dihydropyrimidinase
VSGDQVDQRSAKRHPEATVAKYEKVLRGGTVVNGGGRVVADVAIEGERIAVLGLGLEGKEVFDARGMLVLPGGIDAHVHFQLPFGGTVSADDFENGTKAAACGGVTTVIDFAMQKSPDPVDQGSREARSGSSGEVGAVSRRRSSNAALERGKGRKGEGGTGAGLLAAVEARRAEADGKVCVDYGLHASITRWDPPTAAEFRQLVREGVPTFKMFMIYRDEGWMADDAALFQGLELAKELGAQIAVHAESAALLDLLIGRLAADPGVKKLGAVAHARSRPPVVEWEAIQRALAFAEATGGRLYVVHTSTSRGAWMVGEARSRGVDAFCETCPQYLLLDDSVFEGENGHLYATCPQIKSKEDREGLWEAIRHGSVHVLATDTCTFTTKQKALWKGDFRKIPFGLPGVETLLPLTWTAGVAEGRITAEHWVTLVSENPARIFGLFPRKGVVQPGSDADLVVWDPERTGAIHAKELQTNCDWSPFENFETKGAPRLVFSRGRVVARDGEFTGKVGHGRFLKRDPGGGLPA